MFNKQKLIETDMHFSILKEPTLSVGSPDHKLLLITGFVLTCAQESCSLVGGC